VAFGRAGLGLELVSGPLARSTLLFGSPAVVFDLLRAPLCRDLVLEPAAFEFRLGPLPMDFGLPFLDVSGLGAPARVELGLRSGFLKPTLALEQETTSRRAERRLYPPDQLSRCTARGSFAL